MQEETSEPTPAQITPSQKTLKKKIRTDPFSLRPSLEDLKKLEQGKKKTAQQTHPSSPWAGKDRFSVKMQEYHQRWKEQQAASVGLTDHFLVKASTHVDRCLEVWFFDNFQKIVERVSPLAPMTSWEGDFVVTWDSQRRLQIRLLRSKGLRMLDRILFSKAQRCAKQIKLPKRLQGKYVALTLRTRGIARRNYDVRKIIGIEEERDPHTQQMRYNFTHLGKLHISANTLFMRGSIREHSFPRDMTP